MANYQKITSSNELRISEMTNLTSSRMSESSIDYDLPIVKDIPITQESSDFYKPKTKLNIKTTRKGNMIMMCYNSNGEPLIVIGPHWPFTVCMMLLIDSIIFFYFHFLKDILHNHIKNFGFVISGIQIFSYLLIFILIVIGTQFKVCLRMITDRTYIRSAGTDHDMSAVAAFPNAVSVP